MNKLKNNDSNIMCFYVILSLVTAAIIKEKYNLDISAIVLSLIIDATVFISLFLFFNIKGKHSN